MKREYDFSGGRRGIVVLEPDVARRYPDADAVNRALRAIAEVAPSPARKRKGR